MNINGPNDLLGKINSLSAKQNTNKNVTNKSTGGKNFEEFLKEAFKDVNDMQFQVKDSVEKLLSGETKDIDDVMNKLAQAGIAFDLMVEFKNKVIEAYKQLERMNI